MHGAFTINIYIAIRSGTHNAHSAVAVKRNRRFTAATVNLGVFSRASHNRIASAFKARRSNNITLVRTVDQRHRSIAPGKYRTVKAQLALQHRKLYAFLSVASAAEKYSGMRLRLRHISVNIHTYHAGLLFRRGHKYYLCRTEIKPE